MENDTRRIWLATYVADPIREVHELYTTAENIEEYLFALETGVVAPTYRTHR